MRHVKRIEPLHEVLAKYPNIYDQPSWDAMLAFFIADPIHGETVRLLAAELASARFFRQPVEIGMAAGDGDDEYPAITSGTHRVCAYMLTGATEIEVEYVLPDDKTLASADETEDEELYVEGSYPYVATYVTGPVALLPELTDEVDAGEMLWEVLMSLRIDDVHWITSEVASWQTDEVEMLRMEIGWDDSAVLLDANLITTQVYHKLVAHGYDASRLDLDTRLEYI